MRRGEATGEGEGRARGGEGVSAVVSKLEFVSARCEEARRRGAGEGGGGCRHCGILATICVSLLSEADETANFRLHPGQVAI